ncbi:mannosyltransferase, partial [mine drainage metagenome]
MKVLMLGHESLFRKTVGPGMGTFATELISRLQKNIALDYFTYNNALFSMPKSLLLDYESNRRRIDVVHDLSGVSLIIKKPTRPYILTLHDNFGILSDFLVYPDGKGTFKSRVWLYITKKGKSKNIKNADAIIAVSSNIEQNLIDFFDVPKEKIFVINHGINPIFRPRHTKSDKFVIGTLSDLTQRKDPIMLIDAFKLFADGLNRTEKEEIELDIYGKQSKCIIEKLKQRSLGYNINFKGPVSQSQKPYIYNKFNIFVFPSIEEGFGMPILEAQASGVPVIINGNGMISKEVQKYCLKAYTQEEMADLFYSIYSRRYDKILSNNGVRYTRSFTWEKTAKRTLEVYKK